MPIHYQPTHRVFHLQAADTSYMLQVDEEGYLIHVYFGRKVRHTGLATQLQLRVRAFSPTPYSDRQAFSFDTLPQEYPVYGTGDYRQPAIHVHWENGSTVSDFRYIGHRIFQGKSPLQGLPATYVESANLAETLEVDLHDDVTGCRITLSYAVFHDMNVIARSARVTNLGQQTVRLDTVLTANVDFPAGPYEVLTLPGAWAKERYVNRQLLTAGRLSAESRRGASSHQMNPFMALLQPDANETHGEVFAFNLVYSGSFLAFAEVDQFQSTRVGIGIQPFDFEWRLEPGESFQTPEVVMVYSHRGLGDMSRTFHRLYRSRLARGQFRDQVRPILINNWEATYFQFNVDKILEIAKVGRDLGIELMVLDDGWFGKRDSDNSSLGDWVVDLNKLPDGLAKLADGVNALGLHFGLWFEPEMVSPDSDLYRAHPDWCLHVPDRCRTQGRQQLILDLSRDDVCDYIIESVSQVLANARITYVKWDMNRHMTEIGSATLPANRQRETTHRYMLGLYRVMEAITSRFPNVLFESCSGGGGRFDPGILYYMPQTWTSDNSDAVARLKIQYGTSLVYPASAMGAHVSAVPNHQMSRMTPLSTRGAVAMSGNFGYELDLSKFTPDEMNEVREQTALYKAVRHIVQFGDLYRLKDPFVGEQAAWMFVSADSQEAVAFYIQRLAEPNDANVRLRFAGLAPDRQYAVVGTDEVYGGDELMNIGVPVPVLQGDFKSVMWRLRRLD